MNSYGVPFVQCDQWEGNGEWKMDGWNDCRWMGGWKKAAESFHIGSKIRQRVEAELAQRNTSAAHKHQQDFSPAVNSSPSVSVSQPHTNLSANLSIHSSDLALGNFGWYRFWHFGARVNLLFHLCSALFCHVFPHTDMTCDQLGHWANTGSYFFAAVVIKMVYRVQ